MARADYDCKAAIRWVGRTPRNNGLDGNHIGVRGRSSGGLPVLMLGVSGDVPKLEG